MTKKNSKKKSPKKIKTYEVFEIEKNSNKKTKEVILPVEEDKKKM